MRIYCDVFTNEEFVSELYDHTLAHNDCIMKVKSSYKNKDKVGQIDVGCGNAFGGGEEEEATQPGEEPAEKVLDVPHNFGLVETVLSLSDFKDYFKGYMKKLKEYLTEKSPDRVAGFQSGCIEFYKKVIGADFETYQFFTGTNETLDGGLALAFWEDETAQGPMFYFFKDGLKLIKY